MDIGRYDKQKTQVLRAIHSPIYFSDIYSPNNKHNRVINMGPGNVYGKVRSSYVQSLMNDNQLCCLAGITLDEEHPSCSNKIVRSLGKPGKIGVPYLVTHKGERNNYVIKVSKVERVKVFYSDTPPTSVRKLRKYRSRMKACLYGDLDMVYLALDEFTNEFVIAYLIENLYNNSNMSMNGYVRHIGVTICKPYGINLMEYANMGTLRDFALDRGNTTFIDIKTRAGDSHRVRVIRRELVLGILSQLAANLHFLQETVHFNHGDLKVDNVLLSDIPVSTQYKGLSISADFTVKLADYGKSSITLEGDRKTRIYNASYVAKSYLWVAPFRPNIGSHGNVMYYIVDSYLTSQVYAQSRHMGIPFYLSFDTYTILTSIMAIKEFYYAIMFDKSLRDVWTNMFFDNDRNTLYRRLRDNIAKPSFSIADAIKLLKGIKLKCKGTHIFLDTMRNITKR